MTIEVNGNLFILNSENRANDVIALNALYNLLTVSFDNYHLIFL